MPIARNYEFATHNLGYGELGVYGGGVTRGAPTPRIDKLASEGLRLTNMNMEAQCTPSRSSILTGRYAIRSAPKKSHRHEFCKLGDCQLMG